MTRLERESTDSAAANVQTHTHTHAGQDFRSKQPQPPDHSPQDGRIEPQGTGEIKEGRANEGASVRRNNQWQRERGNSAKMHKLFWRFQNFKTPEHFLEISALFDFWRHLWSLLVTASLCELDSRHILSGYIGVFLWLSPPLLIWNSTSQKRVGMCRHLTHATLPGNPLCIGQLFECNFGMPVAMGSTVRRGKCRMKLNEQKYLNASSQQHQ